MHPLSMVHRREICDMEFSLRKFVWTALTTTVLAAAPQFHTSLEDVYSCPVQFCIAVHRSAFKFHEMCLWGELLPLSPPRATTILRREYERHIAEPGKDT